MQSKDIRTTVQARNTNLFKELVPGVRGSLPTYSAASSQTLKFSNRQVPITPQMNGQARIAGSQRVPAPPQLNFLSKNFVNKQTLNKSNNFTSKLSTPQQIKQQNILSVNNSNSVKVQGPSQQPDFFMQGLFQSKNQERRNTEIKKNVQEKVQIAAAIPVAFALAFGSPEMSLAAPISKNTDAELTQPKWTSDYVNQLTYSQIKGTGLANRCYDVVGEGSLPIKSGYKITGMCLQPQKFRVEEEKLTKEGVITTLVDTKITTRQTYSLTGIDGNLTVNGGNLKFEEKDGIDYAATTAQMPGGERVPFLFTIKNLVAEGKGDTFKPGYEFGGKFTVPSYRTGLFLDPKGRGTVTGYDSAVGLQGLGMTASGDDQGGLFKENNKKFDVLNGEIKFKVTNVNLDNNEVGGVFVQQQPSDTDLGSKQPKTLNILGKFYAQVDTDA